jgi:hypothetical protein
VIEKIGAPERIRTSDPQIRSLGEVVEFTHPSRKPSPNLPIAIQSVSTRSANHGTLLDAIAKAPERIATALMIAIGVTAWLMIIAIGCIVYSIAICIEKAIGWALSWRRPS